MDRTQRLLQNLLTGTLVVCALLVTTILVHREWVGSREATGGHVDDWKALALGRLPVLGTATAPVKIVLFSDYQCPFCKDLDGKLAALVEHNPGRVAVIRYEFPLTEIHPRAYVEAVAAKCAAVQGVRRNFQSALFQRSGDAGTRDWGRFSRTAGVGDATRLSACIQQRQTAALVDADIAAGKRLGIDSVPVFLVNGDVVSGTQSAEALERMVSKALSGV